MTTTTGAPMTTTTDHGPLRLALRLDAAASGALGVLGVAAAPALAGLLGPPAAVLLGVGAFLVVFATGLLVLSARPAPPRPAVRTVVIGNAAWVVASVVATVAWWDALTPLGVGVVLAQAAAVAVFAGLQHAGLRRADRG
jgi:hypothetical protein